MQTMRRLGYAAISPIMREYDWPHRPTPTWKDVPEQRHMAAFLTLHPRCFNLSDMGTGKTLSTLWALDYLMCKGLIHKAIILSPLSTIERVWEDEIFQHFLGRRTCTVLYGSREKRIAQLQKDVDFYIINHDGLGIGSSKDSRKFNLGELGVLLRDRADIDAVIVDEASVYKDSSTNRYKALKQALSAKKYFWMLTGTPVPVDPTNAWALAKLARPEYQESFVSFRERAMYKITTFKWAPKKGSNELAAEILQPAIRYERSEMHNLPEVMIETRDVALSPAQKQAYDEIKKTLKTEVGKGQITAINEASLRQKLIQISCGAVYGPDHEANKIDCRPRLDALREVIEQSGKKILIFAPLTSVINVLHSELSKDYTVERITGNVSSGKRNEVFRDFQQSVDPRIIVADPRTMAHGLTLTAAATTVWYGPTDQPEIYQQANKRMDRPGQTSKMLIVRLASTPVEREIYRRLDNRESMQGAILGIIKGE
jgi:SNF2 family DNA or RNA helicase